METREGYKKTKIGWIPEEWDVENIGDIVTKIVGGGTPSRERQDFYEGDIPWITVKDLNNHSFFKSSSTETISEEGLKNSASNLIEKGNVIISTRMGLGRGFINTANMAINQDMKALYLNYDFISKAYFLHWYFSKTSFIEQLGTGTTVKGISLNTLKAIQIPLPPLPEQKKIAAILTTVDDKISSIDQQIQQTEQLKKGLMEKLLTEGIGHTEFKDTKIGRIPVGWDVEFLENITREKILDGTHFTPNYSKNGVPFLRVTDIKEGEINLKKIKYIPDDEHKELIKRCLPERGDILYSKNGTIGIPKIIDWDWEFSIFVSLALIKPAHQKVSNIFLKYLLNSKYSRREIKIRAKQGTVANLHLEEIRRFRFPMPSLEEQQKIASILSTVDAKIDILHSKKTSYTTLKKGLMAQLLTGQMRVKL